MTIPSVTPPYVQLFANGAATVFAFPFKIFAATDLAVGFITSGTYTSQSGGFTVTGIDSNNGGTIVFTTPPPFGVLVDMRSVTPQVQPTEFANLGAYLPENSTEAFDRLTRIVQDLSRLTLTFGIHANDQEATPWPALPGPSARAGQQLMFDPAGLPALGVPTTQMITAGLLAQFMGLQQSPAEAAASVTPTNLFFIEGDLRRYGGVGSGVVDDSAAWQAAISVGIARIPKGCSFKIVTPATKTGQVTILGEGKTSKLLCDSTVLTVTSGTGSVVDNFWMENIAAPYIITRNPASWPTLPTNATSNTVLGYQPTSNDTDIWGSLTSPQQSQQINPILQFIGAASDIQVSRIYGRFVRISIQDATDSCVQDCVIRGGKGVWGSIEFDNNTNGVQRGANNRAINNKVSYSSFSGIFFSSNDDPTCQGNVCYGCGESGIKTLQTLGFIFTASVGGATSGTLTSAVANGVYSTNFSDGEGRSVTITAGTTATWNGALSAGKILTASAWQSVLNPQCFRGQIVDNHCYQNYYDGLDCDSTFPGTNDSAGTYHQVHNNYAYQNGGDGINGDGQFNSYSGNRLTGNYRFGLWGVVSNSVIAGNICIDNNLGRVTSNHDITTGGPDQANNWIDGNYVWAGGTQNNFGIYAPGTNKIGDNYGVGSNFFFGNAGQITSVVQNYNDASTGMLTDQSFRLTISNNGGTIQHQTLNDFGTATIGKYSSRINGVSSTFTNTPTGADSSTAFAAGGKISSAATNQFIVDTAPQFGDNDQMLAVLEGNKSGTALNVSCAIGNSNVNGVTRNRLILQFNNGTTDAAFALTSLTAGQYVNVRFYGKIA